MRQAKIFRISGVPMSQAFWAEASFGQLPDQKELLVVPCITGKSLAKCLYSESAIVQLISRHILRTLRGSLPVCFTRSLLLVAACSLSGHRSCGSAKLESMDAIRARSRRYKEQCSSSGTAGRPKIERASNPAPRQVFKLAFSNV